MPNIFVTPIKLNVNVHETFNKCFSFQIVKNYIEREKSINFIKYCSRSRGRSRGRSRYSNSREVVVLVVVIILILARSWSRL